MTELRHGITLDQLVLHYQPKIAAVDGRVVGVEALLRWQHPTRGLLAPGLFLPTAESTELITPLTDWVIEAACKQAVRWRDCGRPVPIAINVSRDVSGIWSSQIASSPPSSGSVWLRTCWQSR